jgi:hypothetical protein
VILLSDDILFINDLNTFVLWVLLFWHEYKRDRCERADLSPREGWQSVHQLRQAQKDGVAPKQVSCIGTSLTVLFLQFRCHHGIKIELDIVLAVGKPGGGDCSPG